MCVRVWHKWQAAINQTGNQFTCQSVLPFWMFFKQNMVTLEGKEYKDKISDGL